MSDHWGTPDSIKMLIKKATSFDVDEWHDPCPFLGEKIIKGLTYVWPDKTFVNPPFSDPAPWIRQANYIGGLYNKVIMVLPAFTDRKWWLTTPQPQLINWPDRAQVVHIGRHKYVPLDGQKTSSPRFGSCLVGWNIQDFAHRIQRYLG